jgi:hypothetical protein
MFSYFNHIQGLRIMETGSELSKTVATFIIQKILYDDIGYVKIDLEFNIIYQSLFK